MKLKKKYINICEKMGWEIHYPEFENDSVSLEKHSPAGEDIYFEVSIKNFVEDVAEYAENFDVDENVELWIPGRGERGVPGTIRELLEDAEAIKQMLQELADALEKADRCKK